MSATFAPGKHQHGDYSLQEEIEADVCVVGSGAGGSATACALAERGFRVAVLEEGRHWAPSQFKHRSTWAWRNLYAGRGTRATQGNGVIVLPGGRGVGGSTLINSGICFRTPEPVLAEWRDDFGCNHFSADWMNQCFDRIWSTLGVSVNPPEVQRDNNRIFKQGAEVLGLDGHWMARNAPACVGCGSCQQGCVIGAKRSADRTFLAEALATQLVGVWADSSVELVESTTGGAVVHGRFLDPNNDEPVGTFRVRARHVVVSAGPIGSPRLLKASGMTSGPVGENLHIHPTAGVVGRFSHDIMPWTGVTQGYYVDRWERGYLLQTYTAPPDQAWCSLMLPPKEALEWVANLRFCAMAGAVVHDVDSVGEVKSTGIHYWLGKRDRETLIEGIRDVARVYFAAGATAVAPGVRGAGVIERVQDIERALPLETPALDIGLYASHPMGTCRMGKDREHSVVDPDGRVWGTDRTWVADSSVFPTSLGVNPQVTVYAIGLTVGRNVAEVLARG